MSCRHSLIWRLDASQSLASLRTGDEYLRSLNDRRAVYVDGERVANVTEHPAFREASRSAVRLFDIAADPANRERMAYTSPTTGSPVPVPTRFRTDLTAKRLASEMWSEASFGLIGRTPDHVAGFFCGYAAVPKVFAAGGKTFATNVTNFYEHLRENH